MPGEPSRTPTPWWRRAGLKPLPNSLLRVQLSFVRSTEEERFGRTRDEQCQPRSQMLSGAQNVGADFALKLKSGTSEWQSKQFTNAVTR